MRSTISFVLGCASSKQAHRTARGVEAMAACTAWTVCKASPSRVNQRWSLKPAVTPRFRPRPRRLGFLDEPSHPPTAVGGDDTRVHSTLETNPTSDDTLESPIQTHRRPGRAARARLRRERAAASSLASGGTTADCERNQTSLKLFLGGVSTGATPKSIRNALGGPDAVQDVFLHTTRGFGFVTFRDEQFLKAALDGEKTSSLFAEIREAKMSRSDPELTSEMSDGVNKSAEPSRVVAKQDVARATFAVQCQESHTARLAGYLEDVFCFEGNENVVEVVGIAAPNEPPQTGRRVTERVVLCRATANTETSSIFEAVRADPILSMHSDFFPRVYDLSTSKTFGDLQTASNAAVDFVANDAEGVSVRLETFPPSVTRSPELTAAAEGKPVVKKRFTPRADATHVAIVVSLRGGVTAVAYGVAKTLAAAIDSSKSDRIEAHITNVMSSRAYLKLAEAALRSKALGDVLFGSVDGTKTITAVDVGAAPGGWTQFLAQRGCAVVAIDPAEIPDLPENCRHVKDTAQNAWVALKREAENADESNNAPVPPFALYVSDAVLHDANAQETLLEGAIGAGLLAPNAILVVTFKSAPGRGGGNGYERAVLARARAIGDRCCDSQWFLTHLFANRTRERTFIGVLGDGRGNKGEVRE